ncbi:hypothetical protein D3C84_912600 [compost metagenome]
MQGDLFDLQRHEALVEGGDIIIGWQPAEDGMVAVGNLRLVAQRADVIPLAHAHRPASFLQRDSNAELGKGFDENLSRCERPEINHGARPVQNHGLQLRRLLVMHGDCSSEE